jgi:hypothetical protein
MTSVEVRPEIEAAVAARHRICAALRLLVAQHLDIDPRKIGVCVETGGEDALYIIEIPRDGKIADSATLESIVYLWLRQDQWARTLRVLPRVKGDKA